MFLVKNDLPSVKRYFKQNLTGFSDSERELIVKLLSCKRLSINAQEYIFQNDILFSESDLLYFRDAVKRMQNNEPFQYILGEVEFYDVLLKIDNRALIPRPETEELVDWLVKESGGGDVKIMDLCSGSGCIAFGIKSRLRDASVVAVEYSKKALSLIEENIQSTGLAIDVKEMDVLNESSYADFALRSFDFWISNPPYIPTKDKELMHANVLEFEPEMALFVPDSDPLLFYRKIAEQALLYLKDGGALYFEIHEEYGTEMIRMLESLDFVNIELRKDLQGKSRMLKAQKSTFVE